MYQHIITFNTTETRLLREQYQLLFRHLEEGKGPREQYLAALKQTMQRILFNQAGLKDLWQQVKEDTQHPYHLHLVYKEKELLNLPWQLAVGERIYISKSTSRVGESEPPHPGPLKVLIMISSPEDLDIHHRLSYEEEEDVILRALGPLWQTGQVEVDFTEDGSLETLERKLAAGFYHVLYISGHGAYQNDTGYLLLEDKNTLKSQQVKAQRLGRALLKTKKHKPSLVILASCQSGQGSSKHGFHGVADELTHIGIPAVIAMAASVLDVYATLFAGGLFEGLAKKEPLPVAYGNALALIRQQEQKNTRLTDQALSPVQWLIPQLYYKLRVDHIVDWTRIEDPAAPAARSATGGRFLFLDHTSDNSFIGRRRECARVFGALLRNNPVLLRGQAGIGKTAMAGHLARRLLIHSPRYHVFTFDETTIGLPSLISRMRDYLEQEHHHPVDTEVLTTAIEKANFLLQAVEDRCVPIWIFDNMESCQEYPGGPLKGDYLEWRQFVESCLMNRFPVILTARYPIREWPDIPDESLNQVPFVDFYRKCLSIRTVNPFDPRIPLEDAVHALYTAIGGNYRALELFNEIYRQRPERIGTLLKALQAGDPFLFGELLALLDETAIHALQLLAHFRKPVLPLALVMQEERLEEGPDQKKGPDLAGALAQLHNMTLIERQSSSYYYVAPLVRDWLATALPSDTAFDHDRAGAYYRQAGQQDPGRTPDDLIEAFWHYSLAGNKEQVNQVGLLLCNFFYDHSLHKAILQYASTVEVIAGEETHPAILNHLGSAHMVGGSYDKALSYFEKVRSISLFKKDKTLEATVLNNISLVYIERGDYKMAWECSQKSWSIREENNAPPGDRCAVLNNMAQIRILTGELPAALKTMEKCLEIARQTKYTFGEAGAMNSIGQLHLMLLDRKQAEKAYLSGLALIENTGHMSLRATLLVNLGMLYRDNRKEELAFKNLKHAFSLQESMGDKKGKAVTLNVIGSIYTGMDQGKAFKALNESLRLHREIGNLPGEAATLFNLADAYVADGNSDQALDHANEALALFRRINDIPGTINGLNNISTLYLRKGDPQQALACLEEGLALNKKTANRYIEAYITGNMGIIYYALDDYDNAMKYIQQSAELRQALKDPAGAAHAWEKMADIAFEEGNHQEYVTYLPRAMLLFEEADHKEGIYRTGKEVGMMFAFGIVSRDGEDTPISITDKGKALSADEKAKMISGGLTLLHRCLLIGKEAGYDDVSVLERKIAALTIQRR